MKWTFLLVIILVVFLISPISANVQNNSFPVLYLPFNTTIADQSQNAATMTLNNNAAINNTAGYYKFGNGGLYTNSSGYVSTNKTPFVFLHNGKYSFTVSMWVRGHTVSSTKSLISDGTSSSNGIGFQALLMSGGKINVVVSNATPGVYAINLINTTGNPLPNDGLMHNIMVTHDPSLSSSNWKLYLDGIVAGNANDPNNMSVFSQTTASTSLMVGSLNGAFFLNDFIDDVVIINGTAINGTILQDTEFISNPTAGFTANVTSGVSPLSVAITNTSTGNVDSSTYKYFATNVGGNNTEVLVSTSTSPTLIFSTGNWSLKQQVSNPFGVANSTAIFINVSSGDPVAYFTPTGPISTIYPAGVAFTDTSTGSPTAWNWTYKINGTGSRLPFAAIQNPTFTPPSVGNFTIHLNITAPAGYADSAQTTWVNVSANVTLPPQYPIYEWCGIQQLYFADIPSGIDGYDSLLNYATGANEVDENVTVTAADPPKLIDSYISPLGLPNRSTLYAGARTYNIYGYVDSLSAPSYFTINVSVYVNGSYSTLYNITSSPISSLTPKLDQTIYVGTRNVTLNQTDRILIQFFGYTTKVSSTKVHFSTGGTVSNSFVTSGYFACPAPVFTIPTTEPTPTAVPGIPNLPVAPKQPWKLSDIPWWGWGMVVLILFLFMGMRRRRR